MAHALDNNTKLGCRPTEAHVLRRAGGGEQEFLGLAPCDLRNKRRFDLVVAPTLLFLVLPVMLLVTLLIKLTSPGPTLVRQPCVGLHNRIFHCYKFRITYQEHRDLLCDQKMVHHDPRITPLGRWLRRLGFDDLPQLLNVIKGDMSLVGPRPHAPAREAGDALFVDVSRNYAQRYAVLPGITGWAQVNGYRGATRTRQRLIQCMEFDLHYIKNWSIWFDIAIIWRTFVFVLFDETSS